MYFFPKIKTKNAQFEKKFGGFFKTAYNNSIKPRGGNIYNERLITMKIHTLSISFDSVRGCRFSRTLALVGGNVCALSSDALRYVSSEVAEIYSDYDVILIQYFDEEYYASVRSALVRNAAGGYDPVPVN